MYRFDKYGETDSMSALVSDHYRVLLVMSRFGIGLGFGDKTIGAVCRENGVDAPTFLTVVNMLLDNDPLAYGPDDISVKSLLGYLHNSHEYFLGFRLPQIRRALVNTVGTGNDLSKAIVGYFDEYVGEVEKHMKYEEQVVFPYVRELLDGTCPTDYSIDIFEKQHDQVEARLSEFKNILIRFYPSRSTNEINGVLFDIFNCENDLASHNAIEDYLFVPAIHDIERKIKGHP